MSPSMSAASSLSASRAVTPGGCGRRLRARQQAGQVHSATVSQHVSWGQKKLTRPRLLKAYAQAEETEKDDLGVPVESVYSAEQQQAEVVAFRQHQQDAARISTAEETRTLMAATGTGVLSTTSVAKMSQGYPFGSVVNMVTDSQGRAIISISTLSLHTSDLQASSKCSITVTSDGFSSLADARMTISGDMTVVPDEEREEVRSAFMSKHPDAFYVDFGDFSFYRMDKIVGIHLIGGFGRVAQISAENYMAAQPDPIFPFSKPVASHMNADHSEATAAMVKNYAGIAVSDAKILNLDRLGMNTSGDYNGMNMKIRLPFPRPAEDRKDVKTLIVEMTKASVEFMPKKEE